MFLRLRWFHCLFAVFTISSINIYFFYISIKRPRSFHSLLFGVQYSVTKLVKLQENTICLFNRRPRRRWTDQAEGRKWERERTCWVVIGNHHPLDDTSEFPAKLKILLAGGEERTFQRFLGQRCSRFNLLRNFAYQKDLPLFSPSPLGGLFASPAIE